MSRSLSLPPLPARWMLLLLAVSPAFGQPVDSTDVGRTRAFLASLPDEKVPALNEERVLSLATLPLSCVDRPQAIPENRVDYLWVQNEKPHLVETYEKSRVFYGCSDWHSAVHSLWALVFIVKQYPSLPAAPLIRDRLKNHFARTNVQGEIEFLKTARRFEIPYGYAWVLKLYAELKSWSNPDAAAWADNLAPLAQFASQKLLQYLKDLRYPMRQGLHPNTANVSTIMLDYSAIVPDEPLRTAVVNADKHFFAEDRDCPVGYEPAGTDFLSPCLTEARLMSRLMDRSQFAAWLTGFLPPVYSAAFRPLTLPADAGEFKTEDLVGAKSHLIGLAFSRAEDLVTIANALPPNDPRVAAFRRLAAINAKSGFDRINGAGYEGSHWFATYALLYSQAASDRK